MPHTGRGGVRNRGARGGSSYNAYVTAADIARGIGEPAVGTRSASSPTWPSQTIRKEGAGWKWGNNVNPISGLGGVSGAMRSKAIEIFEDNNRGVAETAVPSFPSLPGTDMWSKNEFPFARIGKKDGEAEIRVMRWGTKNSEESSYSPGKYLARDDLGYKKRLVLAEDTAILDDSIDKISIQTTDVIYNQDGSIDIILGDVETLDFSKDFQDMNETEKSVSRARAARAYLRDSGICDDPSQVLTFTGISGGYPSHELYMDYDFTDDTVTGYLTFEKGKASDTIRKRPEQVYESDEVVDVPYDSENGIRLPNTRDAAGKIRELAWHRSKSTGKSMSAHLDVLEVELLDGRDAIVSHTPNVSFSPYIVSDGDSMNMTLHSPYEGETMEKTIRGL